MSAPEFEIIVVRTDMKAERFGPFSSDESAYEWAMTRRDKLGLAQCESWYIAEATA